MKSLKLQVRPEWCVWMLASVGSIVSVGAQTPTISATALGQTLGSSTVTQVVQFTNVGTAAATSVTITGVTSRVTLGTGTVTLAAPSLPIQLGGLGIGSNVPVSFVLNTPGTVKRFTLAESGTAQDGAGNTYQFSLSQLVSVNFPTITVSPSTLTFSSQGIGSTSYSTSVNITNTGSLPVSFGSITTTGDFSVNNSCGTSLAAGNNCYVYVSFTPTAAGSRTGTLTINDTAAGFPHLLPLTGTGQVAAPAFNFSPTSLTFPAQRLNSTQSQSLTVYNSGNGPATVSSIAISGANASDFSLISNNCGTTFPANYYCYLSIGFTPSASGVRTASVTFTDNAPGSPHTIALSGTGQTVASLSISSTSLAFANQGLATTSASQYVYFSNSGTVPINFSSVAITGANAADFVISANNCGTTLALNGYQCGIAVAFTPTALGSRTAALTITDNATGSPQSISLTGTGQVPAKTISVNPNPLTFATQMVGSTSSQKTVTVQNTGSGTVTVSSATISGTNAGDFSIASNSCANPINVNLYCFVYLTFTPSATGTRTATLTLSDDAGDSPQTIALSGSGQTPTTLTFSPAGLSFPVSDTGVAVSQSITVTNAGTTPAQFSYFSIGGTNYSEFAITANTCPLYQPTLGVGATCNVTISFTPAHGGPRTATLSVFDNAAGSPQILFLGGNGASPSPTLAFQTILLAFNNQAVGTASGQTSISVSNTGNAAVNLGTIAIGGANAGDFAITSTSCAGGTSNILAPGSSCSVGLTFLPTASGPRTAALTFTDNAAGSPQSVPLTGNGIALTTGASVDQTQLNFGTATVGVGGGSYGVNYVNLTNTGTTPLNVSAVAISGTNPGDFVITQNQCALSFNNVLPGGSSCSATINFTPTANGPRSANLTFTDNAPSSPQSVLLSGVGQGATEILSASPAVFAGTQLVGTSTGSSQSVSILNKGTAAVALGAITLSGTNAGDFSVSSANGCSSNSIAAGNYCYLSLSFKPSAAGNRSAILNIASDAPGSPLTIAVTGIGVVADPGASLTPASLNFSAPLGTAAASQIVTLLNTGSTGFTISSVAIAGPADYAIASNTCYTSLTVASGSYCTIQVTYTPSALGSTTASLGVVTSAGNQAVLLSGAGQSLSKTLLAPALVPFANPQGVGLTSLPQAVTIQNTGSQPVKLTGFAISGTNASDFSIASNACPSSLAPSLNCTLGITFTPVALGARTASLIITDDASGSPQTIPLSGTSSNSQKTLTVDPTVDFYETGLNSSSLWFLTLRNTGNADVYVSGFTFSGVNSGDFTRPTQGSTGNCVIPGFLPAHTLCQAGLVFAPTALGARTATLTVMDDASGGPHTVNLIGVGQTSIITLAIPASLSFNATNVGATSAANSVGINNAGNSAASLRSFSISGPNAADFTLGGSSCNLMLLPGSSCNILVTFTPSASGLRTAILQIADNAVGGPHSVILQGAGTTLSAQVALSPNALDLGVTTVGSSSAYPRTVYVTASGSGAVTFTNIAIAGANAGDFTISNNSCAKAVVAAGGQCALGVTFAPAAAGVRNATLVFTDNADGGGTQSLPLTGLGEAATRTLLLSPGAYSFGVVSVDTVSSSASIYVTNTGTGAVTFTNYAITGPNASDFSIAANYCTTTYPTGNMLQANGGCSIQIAFSPQATGTRNATLVLTDNATGGTQSVTLAGVGQTGKTSIQISPGTLAFSSPVGTPANTKYANFTNMGSTTITFSGAALSGTNAGDFNINYNNCGVYTTSANGLSPRSQCSISIGFTPSTVGVETATLAVSDSASATPQTVNLIGQGQSPQKALSVSPDVLSFSPAKIGNTPSYYGSYISLTPAGNAAVTLSGISISGANAADFTFSGCSAGTVIQTYGCSVSVQFTPTGPGLRTAVLQLTDDASGTTQTVALVGSGYVAGAPVIPSYAQFSPVAVGALPPANTVNFTNSSSSAVMISTPTLVGANAGDFAIGGTTCAGTLAPQGTCSVTVKFAPLAAGARFAAVEMAFAGSGGFPADAPVSGDGVSGTGSLAVSAPGVEFDSTAVNAQATNQALTLRNIGQGAIALGAVTITGANAADFGVSYNSCSNTLAPFASCSVAFQFIPAGIGLRTASVQIANNASNSPQIISLIGIGQAATKVLLTNSSNANFGSVLVGGSKASGVSISSAGTANVTLTGLQITGDNAGDFSISYVSCPTVLTYFNCSLSLSFVPSAVGVRNAMLVISSDAPDSPLVLPLSGLGLAPSSSLAQSAMSLDLGVVSINSQAFSSVSVSNVGTSAVNFRLPTIVGANASEFTISSNGCGTTLQAGNGCSFTIAFAPSAVGWRTATLQINDDASGSPQSVNLAGTGQVVSKLLSAFSNVADFGVQDTNAASPAISIPFVSSGTDLVTISGVTVTGANAADFQILGLNSCYSSYAGGSCSINIQFTPSVVGPESATLTVTSDSAAGPILVTLAGVGQTTAKKLIASTDYLDLGVSMVGTAGSGSISLTNIGTDALTLLPLSISGPNAANFAISPASYCPYSLAAGAACYVVINFTPSATGTATATLNVISNAKNSPLAVGLAGTGTLNH